MLNLKVPDMSCGHCAATIEKAVKSLDPAAAVSANLPERTVTIRTSAEAEKVREALAASGYPSQDAD